MRRSVAYTIGGSIASALLIVVLWLLLKQGNNCKFVDEKPIYIAPEKLQPIVSSDQKAIAYIDAYLAFPEYVRKTHDVNRTTYLPLELKSVALSTGQGIKLYTLEMRTDCCTIAFDVSGPTFLTVSNIIVKDIATKKETMTCNSAGLQWPVEKHYRCRLTRQYECYNVEDKVKNTVLAYLNLFSIEFELNGDVSKFAEGKFSTDPIDCL